MQSTFNGVENYHMEKIIIIIIIIIQSPILAAQQPNQVQQPTRWHRTR